MQARFTAKTERGQSARALARAMRRQGGRSDA